MTATLSKIIWLAFGIAWAILRQQPGRRSRKTPVRYSARGVREFALLAASLSGLGIMPVIYVATHFPRFADYPFVPALSYLGIAVDMRSVSGCFTGPIAISARTGRSAWICANATPSSQPASTAWFGTRCIRASG